MIKPAKPTTGYPVTRSIAVALAAVTLAALTACAGPSSPSPVVTHQPVAHPTSPVPRQAAAPTQILDGDCTRLVPLSAIEAALMSTDVAPQTVPSPQEYFNLLPLPTAGGLHCSWQDTIGNNLLDVEVLPNATAVLAAADASTLGSASGSGLPTIGDQSWSSCVAPPITDGECRFNVRVGSYWLGIDEAIDNRPQPVSLSATEQTMFGDIVATIRSLPAQPRWIAPTDSLRLPTSCAEATPLASVRAAFADPTLTLSDGPADGEALDHGAVAVTLSVDCDWISSSGNIEVDFEIIPGSTWAWSATAAPVAAPETVTLSHQPGLGTTAWGACGAAEEGSGTCTLDVLARNTWFVISEGAGSGVPPLTPLVTLARTVLGNIGFAS
jgi:hypothetical protein